MSTTSTASTYSTAPTTPASSVPSTASASSASSPTASPASSATTTSSVTTNASPTEFQKLLQDYIEQAGQSPKLSAQLYGISPPYVLELIHIILISIFICIFLLAVFLAGRKIEGMLSRARSANRLMLNSNVISGSINQFT